MILKSRLWLVGLALGAVLGGPPLTAQELSVPERLAIAAEEKLQNGDVPGAVKLYEEIVAKYPTYEGYWAVKYNLGFAYYQTGSYDKALESFKWLVAQKNADPDLKEQAQLLLGGATAAKASTLDDLPREKLLGESIKEYDLFLKTYPESKVLGEALYGKAAALLQNGKLQDAESTMRTFFQKAAQSTLKDEAKYLLGRIYASQTRKFRDERNEAEAGKRIAEAKKLFDELGQNQRDLVLANEAVYSAGESFAAAGVYQDAIAYLRRVKPKEFLEKTQEELLKQLHAARVAEFNRGGSKQRDQELKLQEQRAFSKLLSIQRGSPLFFSAQQLIAKCYYDQKKFDEVILLNRHFLPHFDGDYQKRARYIIIKALMEKKEADKAIAEYGEFKGLFPQDKVAEDVPVLFANYFLQARNYKDCLKWADEYEATYPKEKGRKELMEQALFIAATAATQSGDVEDAKKRNGKFLLEFPKSGLANQAQYNDAYNKFNNKDYAGTVTSFREFIAKTGPESEFSQNAALLIGISFYELKKYDDCIKELLEFEKKYRDSKLLANVLYQLAGAYDAKRDYANAAVIYSRIVKEFPKEEIGPIAQFNMGINWINQKKMDEAIAAFRKFLELFPEHKLVPNILLNIAEILRNQGKLEEAKTAYEHLVEKFPESENAADAMVTIGEMYYQKATKMAAKPDKLLPDKQKEWKELVQKALEAYEKVVQKFPQNVAVDKALSQMGVLWQTRVAAKFATVDESKAYFEGLNAKADGSMKTKVSFTLGSLLNTLGDKEAALKVLEATLANAGDTSLPNEGYKQYRTLLLAEKQFDKVLAVCERQLKEKQAANDQSGVAEATLGKGLAFFGKEDSAEAIKHFSEVVTKAPWHKTAVPEAKFHLIWIDEKKKNYDEAIKNYDVLLKSLTMAEMDLRLRIWMRLAYSWQGKAEINPAVRGQALTQALGYFLRIGKGFPAYVSYSCEGLYMAGVLSELGVVSKGPKETYGKKDAIEFYQDILKNNKGSPWAAKAQERLKALGQ